MQKYILAYAEPVSKASGNNLRLLLNNFEERAKGIRLPDGIESILPAGPIWLLKQETAEKVLGKLFAVAEANEMMLRLKYLTED